MASQPMVHAEQIKRARELMEELPVRDNRVTRPEAAQILEPYFRKAFRKGYDPSELSKALRKERIFIPAYLIQKFYESNPATRPTQPVEEKTASGKKSGKRPLTRKEKAKQPSGEKVDTPTTRGKPCS